MSEKDDKLNKGSFLYINDKEKAEWGYPEGYPTKNVQITTLMEEQEVKFALEGGAQYTAHLTEAFDIAEGQTYTVNWDGTEYECVCFDFGSYPALGNLSITGADVVDTGEPFYYMYASGQGAFGTLDTSASHTISVKTTEGAVTPMAPGFLPQATQTTYGAVKQAASVPDGSDINTLLAALREAGIIAPLEQT